MSRHTFPDELITITYTATNISRRNAFALAKLLGYKMKVVRVLNKLVIVVWA